jgi:hypothetical protein
MKNERGRGFGSAPNTANIPYFTINIVAIYGPLKVKHDHIVSNYAIA